jgi:hypothetical protein
MKKLFLFFAISFICGCKQMPTDSTISTETLETFVIVQGKLTLEDGTTLESAAPKKFRLPEKYWAKVEKTLSKTNTYGEFTVTFVSGITECAGQTQCIYEIENYGNYPCSRLWKVKGEINISTNEGGGEGLSFIDATGNDNPDFESPEPYYFSHLATGLITTNWSNGHSWALSNNDWLVVLAYILNDNDPGNSITFNMLRTRISYDYEPCQ